jgi:hypothetical protein
VAAVLIVEKDRLPGIAAGGDVIDGAGKLESKGAGYGGDRRRRRSAKSSTDPASC